MFCEKCGTQLPDDAKFCEKCGCPTEPGAVAPLSAVVPAAPSAFSLALKKFFSNKRNVIIAAVALFLVIAAIVTIIVIASQPKKIYIDDYFHVVFDGVDGSGTASITASDKENDAFYKLNKKLFGDDFVKNGENIGKYISVSLDLSDEDQHFLKNGDKVKIKLKVNGKLYDKIDGYKVVLRNKTVKVKGLYKSAQLNLLDYITPVFDGYTGYGLPQSSDTLVFPLINGTEARVEHQVSQLRIDIYATKSDSYIATVYANFDRYDHLANGDTVNLSIDASNYDTSSLYGGYGLILASQTRSYTVSNLDEPIYADLAKHISVKFTGISTVAMMNYEIPSSEVTIEGFKLILSNPDSYAEYSSQLLVELYSSEGEHIRTLTYYANKYTKLKNGDMIKFETHVDVEDILAYYGIAFPQSFDIEVNGLTEPFNADPTSRGTYSFTGYNGYGIFNFDLPEANRIYTTDDGKYTVKLSFDKNNYNKITVVVADENGRNFISFYYNCYAGSSLENGNIVEFYCSEWESNLESYVKDYGIYFPYRITFTVEGLEETTTIDPLKDNITFSFAKDGSYAKMTVGLKEKSVTYGDITLHYSLETYTSWSYKYTKIKIKAETKDGTMIDAGYYQFQVDHLYEGDRLYPSNYTDTTPMTIATGLIFDIGDYYVIASSQ